MPTSGDGQPDSSIPQERQEPMRVRGGRETAQRVLTKNQGRSLVGLLVLLVVGLILSRQVTVVVLIACAMVFWIAFVGFKQVLWAAALRHPARPATLSSVDLADDELPRYSVLIALYGEANMLPSLVESIRKLDYPKSRLQVLLLLEADDHETLAAARDYGLPDYIEVVEIPPGGPRTKPNALDVGLYKATGEYLVVYDAEDRPEPLQLRKAVHEFRRAPEDVVCLQARLAFWNQTSSWVTRFYWAEYTVHFEWVLVGLQRLGIVPPLGGTSNHFIKSKLIDVAIDRSLLPDLPEYIGGWDPQNVTEDAELAGALTSAGYRIAILDSVTYEEATASLRKADRQRRRWLKGYAQTGLVYTREPRRRIREMGFKNWFFFNFVMLGTPLSLVLNPFFWVTTIVYAATRSNYIERLFPAPVYYAGTLLLIGGNLLQFYQLVAAALKRDGFTTVRYMFLVPLWWVFTTWSSYMATYELVVKPHYWHKTVHGHDLEKEKALEERFSDATILSLETSAEPAGRAG